MSPHCVCVCLCLQRVQYMWTHTHTQGKHYLGYFPPLPLFRQRSIVSEPKLPHQQPSTYTPHPSLSTQWQWGRNPSFGRGERGISSLSSSQRGNNCRESFTNWPLNLLKRQRNRATERAREVENENDRRREREVYPQWLSVCVCYCTVECMWSCLWVCMCVVCVSECVCVWDCVCVCSFVYISVVSMCVCTDSMLTYLCVSVNM